MGADVAIITEACIDTKDRGCVDVCPVQCIYEYDSGQGLLVSEAEAGSGIVANSHQADPDQIAVFGDTMLYVNTEECTACTACYEPGVCPVGAIYSADEVPDGTSNRAYNGDDPHTGHDHTFFIGHNLAVFKD